ncbi:hypothetical protein NKH18_08555 [Streptomyces sp. M10(2022)]
MSGDGIAATLYAEIRAASVAGIRVILGQTYAASPSVTASTQPIATGPGPSVPGRGVSGTQPWWSAGSASSHTSPPDNQSPSTAGVRYTREAGPGGRQGSVNGRARRPGPSAGWSGSAG